MNGAESSAVARRDRRNIDNGSAAFLEHPWDDGLCAKKGALCIKIHHFIPTLLRQLECFKPFDKRAGVINKNVDRTETFFNFPYHPANRSGVVEVSLNRDRLFTGYRGCQHISLIASIGAAPVF